MEECGAEWDVGAAGRRIAAFAAEGGYRRVALELGSALLGRAAQLLALLPEPRRFVVQGERWHGGCCLDLVGDAHVSVDAIVHFGEWCFSLPPVSVGLLVEPGFPSSPSFSLSALLASLPPSLPVGARLLYHPSLSHVFSELQSFAAQHALLLEEVPLLHHANAHKQLNQEELFSFAGKNNAIVYVSPFASDPRAVLLALSAPSPSSLLLAGPSALSSSLFFGRRLRAVAAARRARATGLLAVQPSPSCAQQLRALAAEVRSAGRVPYTLCVGKAGPIKLMNLPGLSVFVLVGCPMSTLLLAETLASPVCTLLTPLEHALACRPERDWKPLFLFGDIGEPSPNSDDEEEEQPKAASSGPLALLPGDAARQIALVSPAAAALRASGRWVGLDPTAPDIAPAAPVQGRSGIASQYKEEPT